MSARAPSPAAPDAAPADEGLAPWAVAAVHAKAAQLTEWALVATAEAGSGHPTSAASLAHLVTSLMYAHMRWDPRRPDDPAADRLVLSEGHACPIVYAAAADLGVAIGKDRRRPMTLEDAFSLREIDSPIDGHPNPAEGFPFFPAATGSLGQGLSIAAGIALAARLDGRSKHVFCLIGDGESREGQVWEAADFVVERGLHAVCPVFNANGFGQTGPVSEQQSAERLADKLAAFGFEPIVLDGHDPAAIAAALERHRRRAEAAEGAPIALVARTVKGWGSPSLASQPSGKHGKPPEPGEELDRAIDELHRERDRLGARGRDGRLEHPASPPESRATDAGVVGAAPASLHAALEESGEIDRIEGVASLATREAYGIALRALAPRRDDLVVLDGDVSDSTHAEDFLEGGEGARERFIECRIAEQNMVSCAVGLASEGKAPFASSFGKFLTRAYDQLEMGLVARAPLRLVGSHVGIGPAADGPSQMALSDSAWFASLARLRDEAGEPLLYLITPSDAVSAYALTLRMAERTGAAYLRTMRQRLPLLYAPDKGSFRLGGHRVLRRGDAVMLAAWGQMVHEALGAADELAARGFEALVVDLYSLPFDEAAVVGLARSCSNRVLTLEDDYGGALGAAVAEALAGAGDEPRLVQRTVRRIPKSARDPHDLLDRLELTRSDVVDAALALAVA